MNTFQYISTIHLKMLLRVVDVVFIIIILAGITRAYTRGRARTHTPPLLQILLKIKISFIWVCVQQQQF